MKYYLILWKWNTFGSPEYNETYYGEHPAEIIEDDRVLLNFWEITKELYEKLEKNI